MKCRVEIVLGWKVVEWKVLLPGPIPGGEERPAGREGAEGDGAVHERLVEDDDVGDDLVQDAARAAAERGQALAVDAGDDRAALWRPTSRRMASACSSRTFAGSRDQHERIDR